MQQESMLPTLGCAPCRGNEFTNMVSGELDYNGMPSSLPMKIERSVFLGIPAVVLAGLVLYTYMSYRHDIGAAEARISSGSRN